MATVTKKKWDPFRLISNKEYYDNLDSINTFNKQIRLRDHDKKERQGKAA